ncbi:MAG: YceI family protein [Gemmatimonadales bacterium]|nr:YceI family protein [Gemmatimonadales bacterium]
MTATAAPVAIATWTIDPAHSELTFRIRHLIGKVRGRFTGFAGTLTADPAQLAEGRVEVTIEATTIDTANAMRDEHLRSPDFFDVATFPTIAFASRALRVDGERLVVEGDLTLRGVTRPVTLTGEALGQVRDPWGQDRLLFEAAGSIDRREFGIVFNQTLDTGTLLGDTVEIGITLQAIRQ